MEEIQIIKAYLDELNKITVLVSKEVHVAGLIPMHLHRNNESYDLDILEEESIGEVYKYICRVPFMLDLENEYNVSYCHKHTCDLLIGAVIRTKEFDELYAYTGNDLGAYYHSDKTIFKVWAPTASKVELNLYNKNGSIWKKAMKRAEKGTWSLEVKNDLEGARYMYNVCVNHVWNEAVDPYAKAVTANGKQGVVIDLSKTKLKQNQEFLPSICSPVDAVIYETHIRDFTYSLADCDYKGKYLGMAEDRAISYLQYLGITHVQLLPFHDFEEVDELAANPEYNWGYNPVHYNVPEGSYSTDPTDPYKRIIECKQMISTLHENEIRVVMDVVFNHVYIQEYSSFEKIVPGYYFRYDENGMPSDGTGVGNDTASERYMMRKFIVDSVLYWAEEYGIDAFRFDLMGIHDITTMKEVHSKLQQLNPSSFIIGEGWSLNTPLPKGQQAINENSSHLEGIGFFNDQFRNHIKGDIFDLENKGYILGSLEKVNHLHNLMTGSIGIDGEPKIFHSPAQSVNYIECHDNHTLWDKLSVSNLEESEEDRQLRQMLGISMTIFSQGIPFLHSGMEFFRTKFGEGNSYNSPDFINRIQWEQKEVNQKFVDYVSGLISIRKAHPVFRMNHFNKIKKYFRLIHASEQYFSFGYFDTGSFDSWKNTILYFNPSNFPVEVELPTGEWLIAVKGIESSVIPLQIPKTSESIIIEPTSTLVIFQPAF